MDKEERQKALDRIARARQHHEAGSDVASQADSTITTSVALEEEKEEDEMVRLSCYLASPLNLALQESEVRLVFCLSGLYACTLNSDLICRDWSVGRGVQFVHLRPYSPTLGRGKSALILSLSSAIFPVYVSLSPAPLVGEYRL